MGQEIPLEKEMASTPVFLLENPMDRETLQATQSMGSQELDKHFF